MAKGGRAKGRAPAKPQKKQKQPPKTQIESHEVFDADLDTADQQQRRRQRNVERVGVRDYSVDEIDSEDDEEIDSDAAFDESDEERFRDFQQFFRAKAKRASDEEDEDEDEDEEDEANLVDLSEMLDAQSDGEQPPPPATAAAADGDDAHSDDLSGFGSSSSDDDEDDDVDDAERLSRLDGFVSSISARAPRRQFIADAAGGALAEDAHAVGTGMHARGVTLALGDLLGSGEAAQAGGEAADTRQVRELRDRVKQMESAARRAGAGVAAAPVARRLQDQMDRTVAYAQAKRSVSEWQPTVSANRAAEHLAFPLNDQQAQPTTRALVGDTHAATDMETQISRLLEQSGMADERHQRQLEELELQQLTPEQIRLRHRDLRAMRDLMFRAERQAKRTAKIKSKTYRRILKKDKMRGRERALEVMRDEDPEMYAELVEKMARDRAEERITLRHKNTGKWARAMATRSHSGGALSELREQLDRHDELKRKIHDLGADEDPDDYEAGRPAHDDDGAESSDDPEASFADIRGNALAKLRAQAAADSGDEELPANTPHKALFEMKFMRSAMQRKREQAAADAQLAYDEFDQLEAPEEDGADINRTAAAAKAAELAQAGAAGAPGRMVFGGRSKADKKKHAEADEEDTERVDGEGGAAKRVRLNEAGQVGQVAAGTGHRVRLDAPLSVDPKQQQQSADAETDNPWLDASASAAQRAKSGQLDKDSRRGDKLSQRLREKRRAATATTPAAAAHASESAVLLDVHQTLTAADNGDSASDTEMVSTSNPNAFKQRELVEQAFAEDSVVEQEFAQEKEAAMDEDAPKDQDVTLPGWGSWGGTSIQPKKNKVVRRAIDGVERGSRLDAQLGSVVINQRLAKSSVKYMADSVPFPFYSSDHYETTMQAPLGREWNTTKSHSRLVKPRLLTKAGRIIDPISIPSKKLQ
ncbi:hypothetical protein LPJ63_001937 [Coemansia sp. RSA 2711]|nr:hypothetical protein LPJ63_001937 [Coemansia sp. RSA 2711]